MINPNQENYHNVRVQRIRPDVIAREAGLREPRGGAVTVMQRFSSDLRTDLHLPDGERGPA